MSELFLGIGAQKAGTSWLHRCLGTHPDVWMPPVKEIHFFDELDKRGRQPLPPRIFTRSARVGLRELGAHVARSHDWTALGWGLRYFFLPRDIDWYRKLMARSTCRLVGDITPAYATLSDETVRLVSESLAGLRAIMILRNPIDRAFSHASMDLARVHRAGLRDVASQAFYEHFQSIDSRKRTDYVRTIERWQRFVGRDRLLVAFFEEIARSPVQLLEKVTDFLQLPPVDWARLAALESRVNAGEDMEIPLEFRRFLARMYRHEIEAVADRYGGYAEGWRRPLDKL